MQLKRALIVDDDAATREGLSELLEGAGFECTTARTFHEALFNLRQSPPDLLITDVRLGGYNGLHLVISCPATVRAVVISGFPDVVLESEAIRYGAAFVHKPIEPQDFLCVIAGNHEPGPGHLLP